METLAVLEALLSGFSILQESRAGGEHAEERRGWQPVAKGPSSDIAASRLPTGSAPKKALAVGCERLATAVWLVQ